VTFTMQEYTLLFTDPIKFRDDVNKILQHIQEWFNSNLISLNWEKTHFMHFTTKNNFFSNFYILYKDKKLTTVDNIKFLGLTLDNSLSWKKKTYWGHCT
jgi:hypothetical protein